MRILYNTTVGCRVLLPFLHRPKAAAAAAPSTLCSSFHLSCFFSSASIMPEQRRRYSHHANADDGLSVVGDGMRRREKSVVVLLGATGTGKSKLSIDLAERFSGEVVNTDKIQVYRGLDVTTNKIPTADRRGVPHHLLGELDPTMAGELPPSAFRNLAAGAIAGIVARRRVPVLAGGSNSFVHAALSRRYDPGRDPFAAATDKCRPRRLEEAEEERAQRYRCCFLWVDVEAATLEEHLDRRVDEMIGEGMVEELGEYFAEQGAAPERRHPGLAKAIGVPEFKGYFFGNRRGMAAEHRAAVAAIKENTRRLAEEQVRKIRALGEEGLGWRLRRVDATSVVEARMAGGEGAEEAWERDVLGPSVAAVESFLEQEGEEEVVVVHQGRRHQQRLQLGHQRQQLDRHHRRSGIIVPARA